MPTQAEIKHQRLMEQAERLFLANGFKNITMEEIASAAGISKMTIYNHFDSKDHLVETIMMEMIQRFNEEVEEAISKTENTFEKLQIYFEIGQRASEDYTSDLYRDLYESPYLLEKIASYKKETTLKILLDILEEGAQKGVIREMDQQFIVMLLDIISAGMIQTMHLYDEKTMLNFNRQLTEFIKRGLMTTEGR